MRRLSLLHSTLAHRILLPIGKANLKVQAKGRAKAGQRHRLFAAWRSSTGTARQESRPPILQIAVFCKSCPFGHRVGCRWEGETPVEPRGKGWVPSSSVLIAVLVPRFQKKIFPSFFARSPGWSACLSISAGSSWSEMCHFDIRFRWKI